MPGRRSFVGVPLPPAVAATVAETVLHATGDAPRGFRRMRAATLHVTLAFLGNVPDGELEALGHRLAPAVADHPAHRVEVGGGGTFTRAGVVWVGVHDPTGAFDALHRAVADVCGVDDGRPFHPHVTVARGSRPRAAVAAATTALDAVHAPMAVDRVVLFGQGGGWYEELVSCPLRPA